jgi:hypothetical protein
MHPRSQLIARRSHLARLMSIWRSAGWPCRDAIELDLLSAGWAAYAPGNGGQETLYVTAAGIRVLAEARGGRQRSLSAHALLVERMCRELARAGRIVWRELALRAMAEDEHDARSIGIAAPDPSQHVLAIEPDATVESAHPAVEPAWRAARPDIFSVRHTSVEAYLQPMVHEIKVSRADLLADMRNAAKRASYRWLSCETYYVFPSGVSKPEEIPEPFGVWVLQGTAESGTLEMIRPARHTPCKLPFSVWMALARAAPVTIDEDASQGELGAAARDATAEEARQDLDAAAQQRKP